MPSNGGSRASDSTHDLEHLKPSPAIIFLLALAALLPAIIAYAILYRESPSVPYQDDYVAVLAFATGYEQLPTLPAKVLDIATAQYNEYKLGFAHVILASELELTHHLNFPFLIALGNSFLLPIGYLLWLTFVPKEGALTHRLLAFLPISLIFFALSYWQTLDWAMTGLQNVPIVLFSLLAIYLLAPAESSRARLLLACLAAAVAAFTSANGFLLGPVGLLILIPRRAYARSVAWCASFVLPLAAYLYHYTPSAYVRNPFFYITRPLFFLAFFGCVAQYRWGAALLGSVVLILFGFAVRSRFDRANPAAFYFAVWILATGCLVAWVRGAANFSTSSRYSIYSELMLIFCYSFLAHYLPRFSAFNRRRFYVIAIAMAAMTCIAQDVKAYRRLDARRRMILSGIELYRANPAANSPMVDPDVDITFPKEKELEHLVLNQAIQKHIYTLPPGQQTY